MSGANERFLKLEMKDKIHTKSISNLFNKIDNIDENSLSVFLLREIRDYLKIISEGRILVTSEIQTGGKTKTTVSQPDDFIPMPDISRMTSNISPATKTTMKADLKTNLDNLNKSK